MCYKPTKYDNEKARECIEALITLGIIDEIPDFSKLYGKYPDPKVGDRWLTSSFALVLIREVGEMNGLNYRTLKVYSFTSGTEYDMPDFLLGWKVDKKSPH